MSPIYASNKRGDYEPAPAGPQHAICCDVVDLGMILNEKFNKLQHKIEIRWQSEHIINKSGKPFLIIKRYTNSLNEKARLRLDLESWLGRPMAEEELVEFDLESLLDRVALISIVHNVSNGKTYGNVSAIMPPMKGAPPLKVEGYERVCARPGYKPPSQPPADEPPPHGDSDFPVEDDQSIPF